MVKITIHNAHTKSNRYNQYGYCLATPLIPINEKSKTKPSQNYLHIFFVSKN